ncbi:MAG: toll/interleukin-1 receptor domain-containing protein [Cyanobacteria bacterium P01_H01_bin.15]
MAAVERNQVFISYSHQDTEWFKRLSRMLAPIRRQGLIEQWDDTRIQAGQNWRKEIDLALAKAKVAVLLVSDNFLESDFINEVELPKLLDAAENEGLTVIWLLLSPCVFEVTPIVNYQAAYRPLEPLCGMSEAQWKQKLKEVWTQIEAVGLIAPVASTAAVPTFQVQLKEWFETVGYEIEGSYKETKRVFAWVVRIPERRKFVRVLVWGVNGKAVESDFEGLVSLAEAKKADEGWLVAKDRMTKPVRELAGTDPSYQDRFFCYTFDEVIDETADFTPYVEWLQEELESKQLEHYYVPIATTKK